MGEAAQDYVLGYFQPELSQLANKSALDSRYSVDGMEARGSQGESGWLWMIANSIRVRSGSPRTDVLGHSQSSPSTSSGQALRDLTWLSGGLVRPERMLEV